MKKFLQKMGSFKLEESFSETKQKFLNFIRLHPEVFCLSLLLLSCLMFLFFGLGKYPLTDVDETRYAVMARDLLHSLDWNSLMLNGVPFLEKPPLYFWLVGASIKLFHTFSPFSVRFPIAVLSSFLIFSTYYLGKKVLSRKFGMISALVLLSSIFFLIFAHVAILDMVLTVFVAGAIYSAFLTHFCQEKNKKYFWFGFYVFIGLGFLSKGLLALALPVVIIFTYNLLTKTLKDMFKPINLLPGLFVFLLISLPWHLVMYQEYGFRFVREYFLAHHFARFINSVSIGRERPFLYFVPVFLLGFLPWTFTFIAFLIDGFKKLGAKYKAAEGKFVQKLVALVNVENNEQKLILFASIAFIIIFLVFSSSSTKLPTYILPVFPFASLLMGYYWWVADERSAYEKSIYNSTIILSAVLLIASFVGLIGFFFLPDDLQTQLVILKHITLNLLFMLVVFLMFRLKTKRALSIFAGYLVTMFVVISIGVFGIFNFIYSTGQNELEYFSFVTALNDAREQTQLVTFDFAVKPSVLIEYPKTVNFITDPEFDKLDKLLENKKASTFVIVKNKNFADNEVYQKELTDRLNQLVPGKKYSLYVSK